MPKRALAGSRRGASYRRYPLRIGYLTNANAINTLPVVKSKMGDVQSEELNSLFAPTSDNGLPQDVLELLESILRLYGLPAQELFYKWDAYCLKMGPEDTVLDLATARMFKKDVEDSMERNHPSRQAERKIAVTATPKTATKSNGVYGMLDELTPGTAPRRTGSAKRRNDFETPAPKRVARPEKKGADGMPQGVSFAERPNAGSVIETLNDHITKAEAPIAPHGEARVKIVANTEFKKFGYKPMSMRLTESSEVLDERIDDFMTMVQKHHKLEDNAFGNAAAQSTSEVVAVGRIASDTSEGKLNKSSVVLEMSRRMGAGLRVSLNLDQVSSYSFFPGQIVAVRGTNASGLYFHVTEVLSVPHLPIPVTALSDIEAVNERLGVSEDSTGQPLNIIFAAGPYTADDNLDFEPLQELCNKAVEEMVDTLVLTGPFLDIEHPLLAAGDFELPDVKGLDQDASINTLFRLWISSHIEKLCAAIPSITIIMVPSVRDMVSKHVSWPQERIVKKELGLPKQVSMVPDPCFISLNEIVVGITSHDILFELSREQLSHGQTDEIMDRLPKSLIQQRHFFPLYPSMAREKLPHAGTNATGACIDLGYWKLGEWPTVTPDILVLPSMLTPNSRVSHQN